jgi:hypothetical protein
LSFELASKEVIARNLGGIPKKDLLSGLRLDLKKKGRTILAILLFTLHVEAIKFTQHEHQEKFVVCIVHVAHYIVHITHKGHRV